MSSKLSNSLPWRLVLATSGVLAILSGIFSGLGCFFDFLSNPSMRWIAWLFTAALFFIASLREPRAVPNSTGLVSVEERPLLIDSDTWSRWRLFSVLFLAVLVSDITINALRYPIEYNPIHTFRGTAFGFIRPPEEKGNNFVLENISNVAAIRTHVPGKSHQYYPFVAETKIRRQPGTDTILISDVRVEVVRYEEMPEFKVSGLGNESYEEIEAYFVLEKGDKSPNEKDPWNATLEAVEVDGKPRDFNISIEDFTVRMLRYHISSFDAGIYWVRLYIVAEDGLRRPRDILVTPEPIPLAFFEHDDPIDKPYQVPVTNEEHILDLTKRISATERWVKNLENGEWIPFPLNGGSGFPHDINVDKDHLKQLKAELQRRTDEAGPRAP